MTKQEAIASLRCTKVYVNGKSKEIQEKLFSLGIAWGVTHEQKVITTDIPFLFIGYEGIFKSDSMEIFSESRNREITADYILDLQWDEEKPVCSFKPFDKVLVRDYNNEYWHANLFSHFDDESEYPYVMIVTEEGWRYCLPYEGNEHLLGTTCNPNNN